MPDKIQKERGLSALGRSVCSLQTNRSFAHELISDLALPPTRNPRKLVIFTKH